MNIALTFPDCHRRGGVERIMVECANYLALRNHQVSVLSATFDQDVLHPAIQRHEIPLTSTGTVGRLKSYRSAATEKLKQLESAADAPFVHAAFGVTSPPDGILWVQSVHAEWIRLARASRNLAGRLKQRLNPFHPFILRLERDYYSGRQYRKLIALTPRVREELMEHYSVPADDIVILPNGYNPQEFNPSRRTLERETVRAELQFSPGDKVLLFVANELERKGFFPLVHAVASIKDPQFKLLVVGRVSLDPHQSLFSRLGIQNQVRSIGLSPDVGRYYAAADLFVLPTYYEAWGLVIVEALAAGIPVLTSRLAGASVAVSEGNTGLLLNNPKDPAEIAQKIDQLVRSSPKDPAAISHSVRSYQWSEILVKYESILNDSQYRK